MPPPDTELSRFVGPFTMAVDAVRQRSRIADVLKSAAAGSGLALLTTLGLAIAGFGPRVIMSAALVAAAIAAMLLVARRRRTWTRANAAARLERACPPSRNLIVTAEELLRHPHDVRPPVVTRVVQEASHHLSGVKLADVVPLGRAAALCLLAIAAWLAATVGLSERAAPVVLREAAQQIGVGTPGQPRGPFRVLATLMPPAYLRAGQQRLVDPERIEAIAGTELSLAVTGVSAAPRVRLGSEPVQVSISGDGAVAQVPLRETTYLAVESTDADDVRRLIPVIVTPDRSPAIRIEQPGRDLLLPDATASIAVAATATDDFELASLELRFTKVSGSGEQFEFEEGTIPLRVARESVREWNARGTLVLPALKLEPGSALVYRIVGRDRRSGDAGLASSDTYFVEIAGPEQVTLAGFELPPDRERYALSQQMILLKIQRLRARERTMAAEAVREEAAAIAVEQRSVRANFIFLMGGHVEDEEEEAAHSHEIQEGRLAHDARREINTAIQHMSRVEQALVATDTGAALPEARAAVEALQRAFGRNRYLLRTLPVRSRLDPSRRLSGELDDAEGWRRAAEEGETSAAAITAREILAQVLELAPALAGDPRALDARRFSKMAERALSVDAASPEWQRISRALEDLRDSVESGRARSEIEGQLAAVVRDLRAEAQQGSVAAVADDPRNRRLRGAWADTGRK